MKTDRNRVMSRKRKPTVKELAGRVEDMTQQILHIHQGLQVILGEMNLVSTLLLNDLKERGKLLQVDCPSCGNNNNIPLIAGMEVDDLLCRFCETDLESTEEE